MKFTERREFIYDPEVFRRQDVQTALRIHDEAVRRHSGRPYPVFYEVDRKAEQYDSLWLQPTSARTQFSRTISLPCIVQFDKKKWDMQRTGRPVQQRVRFWTSHVLLAETDYFPTPGDFIYWDGYRLELTTVEFEPNAFWQQTNVWLGVVYVAQIVPDGDLKPLANPSSPAVTEMATLPPGVPLPAAGVPLGAPTATVTAGAPAPNQVSAAPAVVVHKQVFSGYGAPTFRPEVAEAVYTDKATGSMYMYYDGMWH